MIIGFAGKKESGKSTAAEALLRRGFRRYSFARPIKRMVRLLLRDCGLDQEQLAFHEHHKEDLIPSLGVSFRQLCQTLGTEWGRACVHPDLWVIAANEYLTGFGDYVVDDVRFENEATLIRQSGGLIIHVRRPGLADDDAHASESGIAWHPVDAVIDNDGDVEQLHRAVWAAVNAAGNASSLVLRAD